tara:strand:- start:166 stop:900 length:735 start_codon:yes stop_codon:yes gene_type:complete
MEQANKFPTEIVDLPSKGLLYAEDSPLRAGTIEMKYMTAKEEDILTNQNFIQKGTVIDKLLQALIVNKDITYNDILVGDKNALLVAARILGYGKDYDFTYLGEKVNVDLSAVQNKPINESKIKDGKNEFTFLTPSTNDTLTFKLLTHGDELAVQREIEGLKKMNKESSAELSTRLKYMLLSVNGDEKAVRPYVDNNFLARDSRAFRKFVNEIQPDVDLKFYPDGAEEGVDIPIGITFLWPDANL